MGMIRRLDRCSDAGRRACSAGCDLPFEERCEAYQLAPGPRISAKLSCRVWAKLTGTEVNPSFVDKAEKRLLLVLQHGVCACRLGTTFDGSRRASDGSQGPG